MQPLEWAAFFMSVNMPKPNVGHIAHVGTISILVDNREVNMRGAPHVTTLIMTLALALCCIVGCSSTQAPSETSSESSQSESFAEVGDSYTNGYFSTIAMTGEVAKTISSMTLEQKVAQLFIVEPSVLDDLGGDDGDPMQRYPVGGLLFPAYYMESPDQTRAMLSEMQQRSQDAVGVPLFLCIDEEGGTVLRVASNPAFGVYDVGDMAAIGATGDVEAAGNAASYIGSYLHDLGFNVDLAPVADLSNGEDWMAWRSFGSDADLTSRMVAAQVEGFLNEGVLCSVKHFPGIGGIDEDSHEGRIYSHLSMNEFREGPLKPFAAGIEAGAPFVMVGHLSTPEATGDDVPASLSPAWTVDMLRGEMGFKGIVIVDSLGMGAVYDRYSQYDLGALCLEGGADMLLNPADFPQMYQGVLDAVERGELSEARINEALAHVLLEKSKLE